MRHSLAAAALFLGLLLPARAALAQTQPSCPCPPAAWASLQPPVPVYPSPEFGPVPCCPMPAWDPLPLFAAEVLLGQELGLRGQVGVFNDGREGLFVEGFYGVLFHDLGSSQALGAGARYLWKSDWLGAGDDLGIGPGVDMFFQLNGDGLVLLTPSVDLAWLHALGGGLEWELGLDVGLGVGLAGHTHSGHSGAGDVTPLISAYAGIRF